MSVKLWPLVATKTAGAVVVAYGPMVGGYIVNPPTAAAQGVGVVENIFVDFVSAAGIHQSPTTIALPPGQTLPFPSNFGGVVSVNSATPGHRFSGVVYQPATEVVPSTAPFPPSGQTTITQSLPQYLYQEYNDDEDLLAMVNAFNAIVQGYMDWLTTANLPIYTGLAGQMLDYIAFNVYGLKRQVLPYGVGSSLGPLNTAPMNTIELNGYELIGPSNFFFTTDDAYKRIITWYRWDGDGKQFNLRWLKRRVERFLTGTDGTSGQTDSTYDVSVTFGIDGQININLQSTRRFATFGAMMNVGTMNDFALNEFDTDSVSIPVSPFVPIFKAAVDAGVLKLPFQLIPVVNIN